MILGSDNKCKNDSFSSQKPHNEISPHRSELDVQAVINAGISEQ